MSRFDKAQNNYLSYHKRNNATYEIWGIHALPLLNTMKGWVDMVNFKLTFISVGLTCLISLMGYSVPSAL